MVVLTAVELPYERVGPYSTWLSDASFVAQVISADFVVMLEDATFETVGGVVSPARVVKR